MSKVCIHCGRAEDDHHEFEAKAMPPGCVCPPGEWRDDVPAPCAEYQGDKWGQCARCEHDKACHRGGE